MEEMTFEGDAVKALGDGKVGGYLVRFSTSQDPDLTNDFFTKETDFFLDDEPKAWVLYDHGRDETMKARKLGKGTLRIDDVGLWIEAQLALRDNYEKAVYELAKKGKLGWSSGSLSHLVQRQKESKAFRILTWPVGEASLTPNPAEYRNQAISLKSLVLQVEEEEAKSIPPPTFTSPVLEILVSPASRETLQEHSASVVTAAQELSAHVSGVTEGVKAYYARLRDKLEFRFVKDNRSIPEVTMDEAGKAITSLEECQAGLRDLTDQLKSVVTLAQKTKEQRDFEDEAIRYELWQVNELLSQLPKE